MKQDTAKALGDTLTGSAITVGTATNFGWFDFIHQYAAGIGALCSIIGVIMGLVFYTLNYLKSTKADKNEDRIHELEKKLRESGEDI